MEDNDLSRLQSFFNGNASDLRTLNYEFDEDIDATIKDLVERLAQDAIANRFGDMEFAVDEKGNPDGLKNYQEMLLTIAGDITETISNMTYDLAQEVLNKDDYLQSWAKQLLDDSKGL